MHTQRSAIDPHASFLSAQELHVALVGGLRTPLAALRASLESLAHRFEARDPRAPQAVAALTEVVRIQHNLQTILDADHPVPVRPLPCTLQEIAASAVQGLVPEHRARVLVAIEGGEERVVVDGPLVSRALIRLLEGALGQSAEPALLRVRAHGGRASFGVLLPRFDAPAGSIEALAVHVAERDTRRMGGTFRSTPDVAHDVPHLVTPTRLRPGVLELAFDLATVEEEAA